MDRGSVKVYVWVRVTCKPSVSEGKDAAKTWKVIIHLLDDNLRMKFYNFRQRSRVAKPQGEYCGVSTEEGPFMGWMVIHHQHLPGTVRRLFPNSGGQEDVVSALKHSTFT